jgi:hypothetical protein
VRINNKVPCSYSATSPGSYQCSASLHFSVPVHTFRHCSCSCCNLTCLDLVAAASVHVPAPALNYVCSFSFSCSRSCSSPPCQCEVRLFQECERRAGCQMIHQLGSLIPVTVILDMSTITNAVNQIYVHLSTSRDQHTHIFSIQYISSSHLSTPSPLTSLSTTYIWLISSVEL